MERRLNVSVEPYGEDIFVEDNLNDFHSWFDDYVELYETPERKLKYQYKRYFDAWFGQCCPGHRAGLVELDQPCCYCDFGPNAAIDQTNLQLVGEPCCMCKTDHERLAAEGRHRRALAQQ